VTVRSIIGLQRSLAEAGRIRIGYQAEITQGDNAGRKRPAKLDKFRFTSANRRAVDAVAQLYGGTVGPWVDAPAGTQWEVFTEARELEVVVPPEYMALSQSYEVWSAGGCKRRCDGEHEDITDGPCLCDPDKRECDLHTRLSLMLAAVPGIGLWRLDTKGYYASLWLGGSFDMAALLSNVVGRSVLPGKLRLEEKAIKRPNPRDPEKTITRKFVVPVLDFNVDMAALAAGGSPIATPVLDGGAVPPPPAALPSGSPLTPVPSDAPPTIAQQVADVDTPEPKARRANSAPPLARTGLQPRTAAERAAAPPAGEDPEITSARAKVDRQREDAAAASSGEGEASRKSGVAGPDVPGAGQVHDAGPPPPSPETSGRRRPPPPPPKSLAAEEAPAPSWCASLHQRAEALELNDAQFDAVIAYITENRTTSSKDITAREAGLVNGLLTSIEHDGVTVEETPDGWEVVFP
jgi:hypothetical protein